MINNSLKKSILMIAKFFMGVRNPGRDEKKINEFYCKQVESFANMNLIPLELSQSST